MRRRMKANGTPGGPLLAQLASSQGRRDEAPNLALAERLAARGTPHQIEQLVGYLSHGPNARSDALKVLYELAKLSPRLVAPFAGRFVDLLGSRNNRMAWGAAVALAAIGHEAASELFGRRAELIRGMQTGSVITQDNCVKALAIVAASSASRARVIAPHLLDHLATCRPKDVPQRAESCAPAFARPARTRLRGVLEQRLPQLKPSQRKRVERLLRA